MNKAKVYLAGPITGKSWYGTESWRDQFKLKVDADRIECYSPLRGKSYLRNETDIKDRYEDTLLSGDRAVMVRDFFDVNTADAIVVNFMEAERVSIGTVMEIAWAWQRKIPVIVVAPKGEHLHHHSMLREATSYHVQDLEDAAYILNSIFTP